MTAFWQVPEYVPYSSIAHRFRALSLGCIHNAIEIFTTADPLRFPRTLGRLLVLQKFYYDENSVNNLHCRENLRTMAPTSTYTLEKQFSKSPWRWSDDSGANFGLMIIIAQQWGGSSEAIQRSSEDLSRATATSCEKMFHLLDNRANCLHSMPRYVTFGFVHFWEYDDDDRGRD